MGSKVAMASGTDLQAFCGGPTRGHGVGDPCGPCAWEDPWDPAEASLAAVNTQTTDMKVFQHPAATIIFSIFSSLSVLHAKTLPHITFFFFLIGMLSH